jgi:hypothetical protein
MILQSFLWMIFVWIICWITKIFSDGILRERSFVWLIFIVLNAIAVLILLGAIGLFLWHVAIWAWPIMWKPVIYVTVTR